MERLSQFPAEQKAISVKQFSKLMGVSLGHVYKLIERRELPCIKLGSRYLISKKYALELLEQGDE